MEQTESPLLRRLNGRPQACDPCRSRKVACDHAQPVCNRCRKRRQAAACIYTTTDQGLTRQRKGAPVRPAAVTTVSPSVSASAGSAHLGSPDGQSSSTTQAASGSGYLGFTSYSAVFEETRNSLSLLHGSDVQLPRLRDGDNGTPGGGGGGYHPERLSPTLREMSLFVLRNLPEDYWGGVPFRSPPLHTQVWVRLAATRILQSLGSIRRSSQRRNMSDSDLEAMAQVVSRNTSRPFIDHLDPEEWMGQFTGPNLRWESLGLLFTFWEPITDAPPPQACGPSRRAVVEGWSQVARECLSHCAHLARRLGGGNDLLLYLCSKQTTMESVFLGDASLACWTRHGEAVSLLTFLGRHDEQGPRSYTPSFFSENRRRLFAYAFVLDKVIVSFTGRPPLMSYRYASTPLPLDLRDEDLLSDGATLARAVAALDGNGWNTSGGVYSVTLLRARSMLAFIRDELVEIALSTQKGITLEILQDIKARGKAIFSQLPQGLIYFPENLSDAGTDIETLYARLLVQLEHLQNVFFAERLMLRYGQADEGDLLLTSFEMVSLTLIFWTHKDRLAGIRGDFEWLLMAFAAPGGGILCSELLSPTFHGTHPKNPKLSRSTIVQQLSLLVGFLDWVGPSAPNGALCANCKSIIQRVLDHNLNATTASGGALGALAWDFSAPLDFNFDLLDTFDWLRPDTA